MVFITVRVKRLCKYFSNTNLRFGQFYLSYWVLKKIRNFMLFFKLSTYLYDNMYQALPLGSFYHKNKVIIRNSIKIVLPK